MGHVREAIARIEPHDSPERLRAAGVEVIEGDGRFAGPRAIEVAGRRLTFRSAIVATGSEPALPPAEGLEGDDVLTTDTVWSLTDLPRRLVVLGGGPIGCELGQAFARLGSHVAMVEVAERLLLKEEPEAGALIAGRLRAEGVDVRVGTRAVQVRRAPGGSAELVVETPDGSEALAFDRVLVAAGRRPRTSSLGLSDAGIRTDERGAITVDEGLRTTAAGVFAVGDVTALLPFTHVAAHHARVATLNALYGLLQSSSGAPSRLRRALLFGTGVWTMSYVQLVPMGLYQPPWKYPPKELAIDLSFHLAYRAGLEAAHRLLERD